MDLFGAAGDWGPWFCSDLHAGVVDLPFHAAQCGLEGEGDIGGTPKFRHPGCVSNEALTCRHRDSNPGPSSRVFGTLTTRPPAHIILSFLIPFNASCNGIVLIMF